MLSDLIIETSLNDMKFTFNATRGCLQGQVLAPLLWCLVFDELITHLSKFNFEVTGFADDLTKKWRKSQTVHWSNLEEHELSKLLISGLHKARSKKILKLSRKEISLFIGFMSGHYSTNAKINQWNPNHTDKYRLCEAESETIKHLLCECYTLSRRSLQYLGTDQPFIEDFVKLDTNVFLKYLKGMKL